MVASSRELVGLCREVVYSKKRMHEIIGSWATTENLCMFISIVRIFSLKQWSWVTVSIRLTCVVINIDCILTVN
jgi:hypothetical protein